VRATRKDEFSKGQVTRPRLRFFFQLNPLRCGGYDFAKHLRGFTAVFPPQVFRKRDRRTKSLIGSNVCRLAKIFSLAGRTRTGL
jgi:hypothetical protein